MNDERCGTAAGYQAHNRQGTVPCRDCTDAQAVYTTQYRRRRMLGLPMHDDDVEARWVAEFGDMAQAGASFRAGAVMGA